MSSFQMLNHKSISLTGLSGLMVHHINGLQKNLVYFLF